MSIKCTRRQVALFAGILLLSCPAAFALPQYKVGVITPLSGTLVMSGESVRDSILLADELYDQSDLVDFQIEDDTFLPKNSVTLAKKFVESGVDAIIIFGTPTALAVVPITEQAHMPLLAITIVDRVVRDKQFAVRHFVSWQEENKRIVEETKRRGYRKIAIVSTINDAALSLRDGFVAATPVEIVLNEEFAKEDMDFRTVAAKIKSKNPDAIYHLLFAPQGSAFTKALREVGFHAQIFAVHNVEDPSEIAAADGTYQGIWFVTGDDREGGFYVDAYQKRFGQTPAMGGANAFDYAKMVIDAAEAGIPILQYVKNLKNFHGAFGAYGATSDNSFDLKATIKVIRGKSFGLP